MLIPIHPHTPLEATFFTACCHGRCSCNKHLDNHGAPSATCLRTRRQQARPACSFYPVVSDRRARSRRPTAQHARSLLTATLYLHVLFVSPCASHRDGPYLRSDGTTQGHERLDVPEGCGMLRTPRGPWLRCVNCPHGRVPAHHIVTRGAVTATVMSDIDRGPPRAQATGEHRVRQTNLLIRYDVQLS
jgi:hypothetical protein